MFIRLFKGVLSFPINKCHKTNILRNTYIIMLLMKESVLSFEEKQHNLGLPTFKLPASANTILRLSR